jgi:hypothetical protein
VYAAHSYTPPLDKLLTYTDIEERNPFSKISYTETFGIGPEHIPELIRMATDDYLSSDDANYFEFAAPVHALNALEELHAEAAIEPLLVLYDKAAQKHNEWMLETLVDVYTTIGPVVLPSFEQFLADLSHEELARGYVAEIVSRISERYPETRTECIALISRRLENFAVNELDFNTSLISSLLGMQAVEAVPLMQEVYASGRVDESWCGTWDQVQYELGLKERPAKEERSSPFPITSIPTPSMPTITNTPVPKSTKKAPPSKKAKTKIAKASKKANRRKK